MRTPLLFAAIAASLFAYGCKSDCEQACSDWTDTCSAAWGNTEPTCSDNCDMYAQENKEAAITKCYECYAQHRSLCTYDGSDSAPGFPCFETCSLGEYKIAPMPATFCQTSCYTLGLCHNNGQCLCINSYGVFDECLLPGSKDSAGPGDCCEAWTDAECAAASQGGTGGDNYRCADGTCGSTPGCAHAWWK